MKFFLILFSFNVLADHAVVTKLRGKVFTTNKSGKITQIRLDDKLFPGQPVVTKSKSIAVIKFVDGSTITIGQESDIILKKIQTGEPKNIALLKGYIRAKIRKNKTEDYKVIVRSKTAALGVRGTEFNMIYNKDNGISTAISFEGDVDFSSQHTNSLAEDRVSLSPGEFSTTYSKDDFVGKPTRMSPAQFSALQSNPDLRNRNEKITKVVKRQQLRKNSKQELPEELLGPGYNQMTDSGMQDYDGLRPGGYIDFKTGLYIEPPEDATYNVESGVFEVPQGFGGFDPVTGEYIPPLGLILHPLKGFVAVSSVIESSVKYIRDGVTDVGEVVIDGLSGVGGALESNTGIVGETVGKTVRLASGTAQTTGTFIGENTLKSLNVLANNMNSYLYYGALTKVGDVINKIPLISQLDLNVKDTLSYSSLQRFRFYNHVQEAANIPTMINKLHASAQFKRTFWKKIFVRPRIGYKKEKHFRDHIDEVRSFDNSQFQYGVDLGIVGKIKGLRVQTYFFFDKKSQKKFNLENRSYERYMKDKKFGFSKLIIGKKYMTSRFDYYYANYESDHFKNSSAHVFSLSEIVNLKNKNFVDFNINYSTREDGNIKIYGGKLEYFFKSKINHFKVSTWFDYNVVKDRVTKYMRRNEINRNFGLRLVKNFPKYFSTAFLYEVKDLDSKSSLFDSRAHVSSLMFSVVY